MMPERLTSFTGTQIHGPLLFTPQVFPDERGFFFESWNADAFATALDAEGQPVPVFVQENHSRSIRGVLRGLHHQLPPNPQGKLVQCVAGEVFDVIVDIRQSSPSFGEWVGVYLSDSNHKQLWVPPGFAHGFLSLSQKVDVLYKVTDFWRPDYERVTRWDDPDLAIRWPIDSLSDVSPKLSVRDSTAQSLAEHSSNDLFD